MSYPSDVYAQAMSVLEKRRIFSEQELEKRRELLFARSPRAQQLERMIGRTSAAAAKTVLAGGDGDGCRCHTQDRAEFHSSSKFMSLYVLLPRPIFSAYSVI